MQTSEIQRQTGKRLSAALFSLLLASSALAETGQDDADTPSDDKPAAASSEHSLSNTPFTETPNRPGWPLPPPDIRLDGLKKGVSQSRDLLGQTASALGVGLDSIFGSPDKNQPNESTLILRSGVRFERGGEQVLVNGLKFRADLPATSSKFQLLIRLDDEDSIDESRQSSDSTETEPVQVEPSRQPAAATGTPGSSTQQDSPTSRSFIEADKGGLFLRYIYQPDGYLWQTTFDTGWQLDTPSFSTQAVSYLRTSRIYQAGNWQLKPEPIIFWTEDNGPGVGFNLYSNRRLDAITTLGNTTGINYLSDEEATYLQHGWQLVKTYNRDLRVSYNLKLYTSDRYERLLEEAHISATLRRRISGDWLFFSVTPADTLLQEEDFRSDFSLTFQLEAKFGTQY